MEIQLFSFQCPAIRSHIRDLTLGLSSVDEISVLFYPNPAKDKIYIESNFALSHVSIFDLTGNEVAIRNKENPINVSELARGIYFLKIETQRSIFYRKVLLY